MQNCNIDISEITNQISKIDYSLLLKTIEPIVLLYLSSRSIKSYKLYKDFKPNFILSISKTKGFIKKDYNINKEEIFKKQFGSSILEFHQTLIENLKENNLSYFYNNINNIDILSKNFNLKNLILNPRSKANYNPINNTIMVQEKDYLQTIFHELFHMASSFYNDEDGFIFSGFMQESKTGNSIGRGLNEGYTQLLTERYFENTLKAYKYLKTISEKIEHIVGQDKMEGLYFKANLQILIQELSQYEKEENILRFIYNIDFLEKHLNDKHLFNFEEGIILNCLKEVNIFILNIYKNKLEINKDGINNIEIEKKYYECCSSINPNLIVGKRNYIYFKDEELKQIINNNITILNQEKTL